MKLRTIKET